MNDIVRQVGLASKVASCWVPSVKVVSDAIATLCSSAALAQELGSVILESREKATDAEASQRKRNRPVNRCGGSVSGPAVATMALVAMDRLSGAAAVPSAGTPGSPDNPIPVGNSETLVKIGQEGYPANAHYRQTQNFSHNSSVSADDDHHLFAGHYDGDCYTISGPRRCLFQKLGDSSEVHDLRVVNADINNADKLSAVLACEMEEGSTIRNVRIEDSRIINSRNSRRKLEWVETGVITGQQRKGSLIERAEVKNSSVSTSGHFSRAGIGAGVMAGQIERLTVTDSQVETRGISSHAGVGGGKVDGDIQHLTVLESNISTHQNRSHAGIGGGVVTGNINDITVVKSRVNVRGYEANAGIGGGRVGYNSIRGYSRGSVNNLVARDSHVRTEGNGTSAAGIGGGWVRQRVNGTTAINCSVSAVGVRVDDGAAIGAGYSTGKVINTRAVDCTVTTKTGQHAGIAIGAGSGAINGDFRSLNSRVNGKLENIGNLTMPGLCGTADPRFVTDDCQVHADPVLDTPGNCSTPFIPEPESVWKPIPMMANTTTTGHPGATPLPSVNATITATVLSASASASTAMTTTAPVTKSVVTLPEASMTFAGMPPTSGLPTTPAPVATTVATGVIVSASLGTAFTIFAGIGLYALYQYCQHRNRAPIPAEPEIPLIPLNQQANN
ncbi:hypothetical protein [Endozoicomonas sp. SCSIO W0465]|uniref:hypothetical protein n=1 Tax=Endozoicomonas sp. SCSIO W0465 TaxID=2918516 RepID=UPI0020751D95|nr:hypothetical protein [Endozoicomonas sp. SCSIO W0465]USE37148.1 hypothetical protein MJO57_02640 [Endozoicomonas sp. SCSIO W0465]